MVLDKNKSFITNSEHPNADWIGDADYVIDDFSELARKIIDYYPKIKLVTGVVKETDDDGNEYFDLVIFNFKKECFSQFSWINSSYENNKITRDEFCGKIEKHQI